MANETTGKYKLIFREKNCKQCGICSYFCPQGVIFQEEDCYPVIVDEEKCVGCRLCEMRCPDFAIEVEVTSDGQR